MVRKERFTFLCTIDERKLIADLAKRLQRSQSDAVRYVVVNASRELAKHDPQRIARETELLEQIDMRQS